MGFNIVPTNLMALASLNEADVCYSIKLNSVVKRRAEAPTGKLSGFMSGISNVINDTIATVTQEVYYVRTQNGLVYILSEKLQPKCFYLSDVARQMNIEADFRLGVSLPAGDIESASAKISPIAMYDNFSGNFGQLLTDFSGIVHENVLIDAVGTVISKRTSKAEPYKFGVDSANASVLAYDNSKIVLFNSNLEINTEDILVYRTVKGYCELLVRSNNEFLLVEIFDDKNVRKKEKEFNLLSNYIKESGRDFIFAITEKAVRAESFLSAFEVNGLAMVAVDSKLYCLKDGYLSECGVFKVGSDIYVRTVDNITVKYPECEKITGSLALLPCGYDKLFTNLEQKQPFLCEGAIIDFSVSESAIKSEGAEYLYDHMRNCKYVADDFSCTISFMYAGQEKEIITANSLGIYVCNRQEKAYMTALSAKYNVNQLYDCYYRRGSKNFLAGTFSEVYKTDKLLNVDSSVEELVTALKADDSVVLRNAFSSMLGKFTNIEDTQTELLKKVSLLEFQRKKVQKIFDEWFLYYPHYMATMQVKWLKSVFGNLSGDFLNSEYWKCVNHYKRILSSANTYIQKYMAEISSCTNRIYSLLPDEVKRADITDELRIKSGHSAAALEASANVMLGVSAGMEFANMLIRGVTATSPLAISMSAKMLVDSYSKDVEQRKNVKAFGVQALEWWEIFMSGLRVHILEISNGVNEYNQACLKRDTALFIKLKDDEKGRVKTRIVKALKDNIIDSIDDKFIEIMPQFNMRISNIIDEMDNNAQCMNVTLDEFKTNLFM